MTDQSVEWYLARDGKQFGPVADAELRKLVELGHLKADDLLWRQGFDEWRPAATVFSEPPPPTPPGPSGSGAQQVSVHPSPSTAARSDTSGFGQDDQRTQIPYDRSRSAAGTTASAGHAAAPNAQTTAVASRPNQTLPAQTAVRRVETGSGRGGTRLVLAVAFLLVAAGIVLGLGWLGRASFIKTSVTTVSTESLPGSGSGRDPAAADPTAPDRPRPTAQIKPGAEEAADKELQTSLLWQVMKREFPDWYIARVQETAQLKAARKDAAEVLRQQITALVKLRRQHLNDALSATLPRLSAIATAFHDSLVALSKHSTAACFELVSQGELAPAVIALMDQPTHRQHIDTLMASIFMAIADGRKSPRVYPPPKQVDYQLLTAELTKRGWSEADLQLFSNAQELSKTRPEKVCGMVRDWFAAQLAIADVQTQLRLLAEALKPLISG